MWTEEEIDILKNNYPTMGKRVKELLPDKSVSGIHKKVFRLGMKYEGDLKGTLKPRYKKWTEEEIETLSSIYSSMSIKDIAVKMDRTYNSISLMANKLGLESYYELNHKWTDEEKQYVTDNWELKSDIDIADDLNTTRQAVKEKRHELGLYRAYVDISSSSYEGIDKYLRGQLYEWKLKSMEQCNYQCIVTGSKDFEVHHIINFSYILMCMLEDGDLILKDNFEDYTKEELYEMKLKCLEYHNKLPLGVCLRKDLHKEFHLKYGKFKNTQEQLDEFIKDYDSK